MSTGSNWLVTAGAVISLRDDGDLTDRRLFASGAAAISGTWSNCATGLCEWREYGRFACRTPL
jgi:hypothetical protein